MVRRDIVVNSRTTNQYVAATDRWNEWPAVNVVVSWWLTLSNALLQQQQVMQIRHNPAACHIGQYRARRPDTRKADRLPTTSSLSATGSCISRLSGVPFTAWLTGQFPVRLRPYRYFRIRHNHRKVLSGSSWSFMACVSLHYFIYTPRF